MTNNPYWFSAVNATEQFLPHALACYPLDSWRRRKIFALNKIFSLCRHFTTTTRILHFCCCCCCCFLMLIRAIVFCSSLGLQTLNLKRKTKWILGSSSQMTPSWKWSITANNWKLYAVGDKHCMKHRSKLKGFFARVSASKGVSKFVKQYNTTRGPINCNTHEPVE